MYFNTADTMLDPEVQTRLGMQESSDEPSAGASRVKLTGIPIYIIYTWYIIYIVYIIYTWYIIYIVYIIPGIFYVSPDWTGLY